MPALPPYLQAAGRALILKDPLEIDACKMRWKFAGLIRHEKQQVDEDTRALDFAAYNIAYAGRGCRSVKRVEALDGLTVKWPIEW